MVVHATSGGVTLDGKVEPMPQGSRASVGRFSCAAAPGQRPLPRHGTLTGLSAATADQGGSDGR